MSNNKSVNRLRAILEENENTTTRGGNRPGASAASEGSMALQKKARNNPRVMNLLDRLGMSVEDLTADAGREDVQPFQRDVRALGESVRSAQLPSQYQRNQEAYVQLEDTGDKLQRYANAQDTATKIDVFRGNTALGNIRKQMDTQADMGKYSSDIEYLTDKTDGFESYLKNLQIAQESGDEELKHGMYMYGMERADEPTQNKMTLKQINKEINSLVQEIHTAQGQTQNQQIFDPMGSGAFTGPMPQMKADTSAQEARLGELYRMIESGDYISEEEAQLAQDNYFNRYRATYEAELNSEYEKAGAVRQEAFELQQRAIESADPAEAQRLREEAEAKDKQAQQMIDATMALEDQAQAEYDSLQPDAKRDWGAYIGSGLMKGFSDFANAAYQTYDVVLGKPIDAVVNGAKKAIEKVFKTDTGDDFRNPLSRWADKYKTVNQQFVKDAENAAKNMGESEWWSVGQDVIGGLVQNVPNTIMAFATGGVSAGVSAQNAAIKAMNAVGNNRAVQAVSDMITNPQYWSSFAQTMGNDYNDALEKSGNPVKAALYATTTSLLNAGIEIGATGTSGIEGINQADDGSNLIVRAIEAATKRDAGAFGRVIDSMTDESLEELQQGIVSGLAEKVMIDATKPYISLTDDNAIISPATAKEMLVGGLAGGLMAGGAEVTNAGINAAQRLKGEQKYREMMAQFEQEEQLESAKENTQAIETPVTSENMPLSGERATDLTGEETAYEYGKSGRSLDELADTLESVGIELTDDVSVAYTKGETARETEKQTYVKRIQKLNQGEGAIKRKGTFRSIDKQEIDSLRDKGIEVKAFSGVLSDKQQAAVKALRGVAEKMHINMVYFESPTDAEGNRTGANGFYDNETNTVYLDVFAGQGNDQALMKAAAHELTHMLKEWSPEKYSSYQDMLIKYYYSTGKDTLRTLVEQQIEKADKNGIQLTESQAVEEIVADASEMMFSDIDAMREIANTDKTLFEKIGDWINKFIDSIKQAMEGIRTGTKEAELLMQSKTTWENARKTWYAALEEAGKNLGSGTETAETVDQNADFAENVQNPVVKKADSVKIINNAATKYSLRTWTDEERKNVSKSLKAEGFDAKRVDKWIKDVDGIAAQVAQDKERLDFTAADNQVMLKNNQEYVKTLDASTLCAKRLVYQGTFNAVQHALPDRVMTSDDLIDLRNLMAKKGYETPCGICYVESRRRHLGKFADEWVQSYQGEYKPHLDDVTTTDGLERLRKEHPEAYNSFMTAMKKKGSNNPKVVELRTEYRGDIRKLTNAQIKKIREIGGLRVQSFSDFETPHLLDMMQAVLDMAAKGLTSQAYTKVPNFAAVFGDTGIKINLSLIAEGSGLDEDGNLMFSSYEGMDFDRAMELREQYSENVGTILVGLNDAHIKAAMADDRIDFIIPFHKSGWGQEQMARLSAIRDYEDYTDTQNERKIIGYRKNGNPIYKNVESNFYPVDYWDFSVSGTENAENYLQMCAEDGRIPKFNQFLVNNGDGSYSLPEDGSADGYWKMLIDYKMYDNDGVGAPQRAVQPVFNMEEADRVLREYEGGADTLPVAKDVVSEFVDQLKKNDAGVKYSLRSFDDGMRFVDVQANQTEFDGLSEAEMMNKARDIIKQKFQGKVVGIDNTAFVNGAGAREYSRPAVVMRNAETKEAKMRAAGELDNLLDAGVYIGEEEDGRDGHKHKNTDAFAYYRTVFKVGNSYFEGVVNVANVKGRRLFKDVTKIKNITQDITSSYGENPKSRFLRDVSMNSISENGEGVNGNVQFSQRDTEYKTDRQLLASALEGVTKNAQEAQMLREYQQIAAKLDADERRVQEINERIRELRLEDVNTPEEQQLLEERKGLEKGITTADRRLFQMERLQPLQRIAKIQRKEAEEALDKARRHLERYKEGVTEREYIGKIKKTSDRLAQWLTKPNNQRYVPEDMRKPLAEFLLTIDRGSETALRGGGMTKADRNYARVIADLRDVVSNINAYQNETRQGGKQYNMYIDLPRGFVEMMTEHAQKMQKRAEELGGTLTLNRMNSKELEELFMTLTAISSSITHTNDFLSTENAKHVGDVSRETIKHLREQKPVLQEGKLAEFLNWDNLQPIYAFERYGEGGKEIFRMLQDGQNKLAHNTQEIVAETEKLYTAKEVQQWSEEVKTFTINGQEVKIPVANIMSLYCIMRRAQGVGHVYGEGFRVGDYEVKGKKVRDTGHNVSDTDVRTIINSLTERQKDVAEQLQHVMSTKGSRWGNEVSMKRFGYRMFTERNYFPIEVDKTHLPARTDNGTGNELYRLLNMSSTKPITRGANNRIMLNNIFDVYSTHMSDMATYNSMALPVLDAVKWLNYKESELEEVELGEEKEYRQKYTESVRDAARDAYGNAANKYIIGVLKDINGAQMTGGEGYGKMMLGRVNRASVAANLRVAFLQPLSIVRAGMVLGTNDILTGAGIGATHIKRNIAEMNEHSGIAVWKDLGFYDVNIGRGVKQMIKHDETKLDKLIDYSMKGAEWADKMTWALMWEGAKRKVSRQMKQTDPGFMQEVARTFEEVVYKTQVVDSVLTRSQYMRNPSFFAKWTSSFMSEPTTTYNMLLNAYNKFATDARNGNFQQAWKKQGKLVLRTMSVYTLASALNAVVESFVGALRDEDDYTTFMEKFTGGYMDNFVNNMMPFNKLPLVSDVYEYAKKYLSLFGVDTYGYSDTNVITQWLEQLYAGLEIVADKLNGDATNYTNYGATYKLMQGVSSITGIPVASAMREAVSMWNNTVGTLTKNKIVVYKTSKSTGYQQMYNAIQGGNDQRTAEIRAELIENGAEDKDIASGLRKIAKEDYLDGNMTDEEAAEFLQKNCSMTKDEAFWKMEEWRWEAADEADDYSVYGELEEALLTGTGVNEAVKKLTTHGYEESKVRSKVREIVKQGYLDGDLTSAKAGSLLKQYAGLDDNEVYFKQQQYEYEKLTGDSTSSDACMIFYAIDMERDPKSAIDAALKHGKEKSGLASSITSRYKEQYLNLLKTNKSKAAALRQRLAGIFSYLGYDGLSKVDGWTK